MKVIRNPRALKTRSFGPVPTRIPICNTNVLVIERDGDIMAAVGQACAGHQTDVQAGAGARSWKALSGQLRVYDPFSSQLCGVRSPTCIQ